MDALINLCLRTIAEVWLTFTHNWPFLIVSSLIATALKLYLDPNKVSAFLIRHKNAGVIGATAAAVGTPLCSCGTTAVILGMMASMLPWAPIVAFMVASPLTSPEELVYSAGLFGWPFALAFFSASVILGLLGGLAASLMESRDWLANQVRYITPERKIKKEHSLANYIRNMTFKSLSLVASMVNVPAGALSVEPCGCASVPVQRSSPTCSCAVTPVKPEIKACACGESSSRNEKPQVTPRIFFAEVLTSGKRLLFMFLGFAFIGYFLNGLIPPAWVAAVFGRGNMYNVPLAATLGLPLYINTEASLPLVRALLDGGMSQGAALAFLITGAGTSIGAMAGALTIARWRVIALVIGTLWVGAVAFGFGYDFVITLGLF